MLCRYKNGRTVDVLSAGNAVFGGAVDGGVG